MSTEQQHATCQRDGEYVGNADVKRSPFLLHWVPKTWVELGGRDIIGGGNESSRGAAALVEDVHCDSKAVNVERWFIARAAG